MEEPMGPRPYWATRIFFFTLEFLNDLKSQYVKGLADGLQPNLQRCSRAAAKAELQRLQPLGFGAGYVVAKATTPKDFRVPTPTPRPPPFPAPFRA